jgi:hypothetical protein
MVSSRTPLGRSLLDYSLVACFGLILLLLGILLFDPSEQTSVDSKSSPSSLLAWDNNTDGTTNNKIDHQHEIDAAAAVSKSELDEVEKRIHDAQAILSEKQDEVEKIVEKVENEIKDEKSTDSNSSNKPAGTISEKEKQQREEEMKEKVIEAVVEKELGLDKWCGQCKYASMPFTCQARVKWMMNKYKITEDEAKESTMEYCGGGQPGRRLFGSKYL